MIVWGNTGGEVISAFCSSCGSHDTLRLLAITGVVALFGYKYDDERTPSISPTSFYNGTPLLKCYFIKQMAFAEQSAPVDACQLVKCSQCGKTTWRGCGMHVDAIMKDVKEGDKCKCPPRSWFQSLLGI
ncbi:hypothetical protein SCP_0110500 [Sparassis crispa]|uniref:Uncharacterized protein n=1 Tax=Sparassis crispa TaxID=139825 RepID=A0A401G7N3_9APHY|nr:hypothetical protein SCP_0110500 [Sparassis crispa]GBE78167.1 hypothetical protein SCP_0110500 [Sparassis crispa]